MVDIISNSIYLTWEIYIYSFLSNFYKALFKTNIKFALDFF